MQCSFYSVYYLTEEIKNACVLSHLSGFLFQFVNGFIEVSCTFYTVDKKSGQENQASWMFWTQETGQTCHFSVKCGSDMILPHY